MSEELFKKRLENIDLLKQKLTEIRESIEVPVKKEKKKREYTPEQREQLSIKMKEMRAKKKVIVEIPIVKPIETPIVKPIEIPIIKPVEIPVVKPIEIPVVKPIEIPIIKPVEIPIVKPIEIPIVKPIIKAVIPAVIKPRYQIKIKRPMIMY